MPDGLTKQQHEDFEWFKVNREKLYTQYGTGTLVISNRKVLNFFNDYVEAAKYVMANYERGTCIVQQLSKDESCYTFSAGGGIISSSQQ
ncbi:MAG: hypothetical protein IJ661_03875 [Lachnospiraceae bacterium]|nr:hypothetical protein [Lachnospiraceae bacterium]